MKDLQGNYKILSFYDDAKKLYKKEMVLPRFVSIWLTECCNLRCSYCYFKDNNGLTKTSGASPDKIKKLLDELASNGKTEAIEFSGGGEPTLHKQCFELAEYAVSKGLKIGLLTNGYEIDLERAGLLSYIRIGLDSYDKDSYKLIKGVDGFDRVIANITALVSKCKSTSSTKIGLKFMLNEKNFKGVRLMTKLAYSLGVDYCHFRITHSDSLATILSEDSMHRNWLLGTMSELQAEYRSFVIFNPTNVLAQCKCFMSPIHSVITSEGKALVCCYFYEPQYVLGNVFEEGFSNVWYSKRHQDIIDSISVGDCRKVDCRWNMYNVVMKGVIENNDYNLSYI